VSIAASSTVQCWCTYGYLISSKYRVDIAEHSVSWANTAGACMLSGGAARIPELCSYIPVQNKYVQVMWVKSPWLFINN